MISRDEWRQALNVVAEAYDRYRPSYPTKLPEDVAFLAGLAPPARILEVGCGAGQATAMFACLGYPIVALEPGEALAAFARRRCAGYPNVRIDIATLEDWLPDPDPFDLVLVAQAFHLLDPARRFGKVAGLLGPQGSLAVFWNYRLPGDSPAHRAVDEAYARHAPTLPSQQLHQDTLFEDEIDRSGLFDSVFMRRYHWTQVYTAADYVGLLESSANHHLLPEPSRSALFEAVRDAIGGCGGDIAIHYLTRLYVARRLSGRETGNT